jgi:hypothetical protein
MRLGYEGLMRDERPRLNKVISRLGWRGKIDDAESRTYLQARLLRLSSLMFWSFVAFLLVVESLYAFYPLLRPDDDIVILLSSAGGLALLAAMWLLLRRRVLSVAALNRIDLLYASGTGALFALGGFLAANFEPAPYMCLLFTSLMVLTRAIVVPSSGRRTLALAIIAFVPYVIAGVALVLGGWNPLPAAAVLGGIGLVIVVVSALATTGSQTLYGLRQQASVATQLGQYTLKHKIGEGGMGAVYLATHALLRRPTAVKLLLPERVGATTLDRFEREVQHMSQLTHPNTVAVFDYGRSFDGTFYYAMEYLDGIDLENLVFEHGPLPVDRAVAILIQICGALREAHGRGIIHRDIKPANIILCERGGVYDVAKLLDFGLVKTVATKPEANDPGVSLTLDGTDILGTPAYLSPEAITTPKEIGPPADLYALGGVAYYLLTGKCAFDGATAMAICVAHLSDTPKPPTQIRALPAELEAVILRCLQRSPADRPSSAAALARELVQLPRVGDWDEDRAATWWSEFRNQVRRTHPAAGPQTIEVDLAHRISTD